MKARKAMKRLAKVEDLLSTVMDRLPKRSNGIGDLLATAKTSVSRAKEELNSPPPPPESKKPPVAAQSEGGNRKTKDRRTEKSKASSRLKQTA